MALRIGIRSRSIRNVRDADVVSLRSVRSQRRRW